MAAERGTERKLEKTQEMGFEFEKDGHRYIYRFDKGRELGVICTLLNQALDQGLNLELEDARKLIQQHGLSQVTYPPRIGETNSGS
jgi:hypothetical protein